MYRTYYSLSTRPFSKEIKTHNLFESDNFKETISRLNYLKTTRGIGVIVGESGCGKTSALRAFADNLNSSLFKVIYSPHSTGSVMDFYRNIATGLGEKPVFRKSALFKQIQAAISNYYVEKNVTPVFIMDEMHLSSNKFLNELSILFNFSMDSKNPFVLILSGLSFFLDKLNLNQNQSLTQRVVMKYHMIPLTKDEVEKYIEHHLQLAGSNNAIFTPGAIEAITSNSRGLPRLVNSLATNSLLIGCQMKADSINEEVVFKASEEVGL
ncbi:MAG TPA: AAA family ATPase [Halanaerobiales bacterium]|nr:AAA family ATPase [Halanaerobiales bacterium]